MKERGREGVRKKKERAERRIAKGQAKEWEKLRDETIRPGKREFRSL